MLVLIATTTYNSCNLSNKKLDFVQLYHDEHYIPQSDSIKKAVGYNYIVENYKDNNYSEKQIDSFAFELAKGKVNNYASFAIDFYKASKYTNLKNLKANPRDLDRHSNTEDLVYNYYWSQGAFLGRSKFKNGEIINPNGRDVTLSDPPPLKN